MRIEKAENALHNLSMGTVHPIIRHQRNTMPATGTRSLLILRGRDPKPLEHRQIYSNQVSLVLRSPIKSGRRKITKRKIISLQERREYGHRHHHKRRLNLKEFLRKGVLTQTRSLHPHLPRNHTWIRIMKRHLRCKGILLLKLVFFFPLLHTIALFILSIFSCCIWT